MPNVVIPFDRAVGPMALRRPKAQRPVFILPSGMDENIGANVRIASVIIPRGRAVGPMALRTPNARRPRYHNIAAPGLPYKVVPIIGTSKDSLIFGSLLIRGGG